MRSNYHDWDRRPSGPIPRRISGRQGGLLGVVLAFACLTAPAARTAPTPGGACSTHGVSVTVGAANKPSMRVVQVSAHGVSCAKAEDDARRVVTDLAAGKAISLPGAQSLETVTTSFGARGLSRTKVSVIYPNGTVILALNGTPTLAFSGVQIPFPKIPGFSFPTTPLPSSGTTTV